MIADDAGIEAGIGVTPQLVVMPHEEPNWRLVEDPAPPVRVAAWPEPLEPAAFHGLAGDFVRLVSPHTEADVAALLFSLLVAIGNLFGRHAYFVAEADRHYPNMFAVLAGLSAKGRKGTSFGYIHVLCLLIEAAWTRERILKGLSSGEGLIWAVRDPIEKQEPIREKGRVVGYQSVIIDDGVTDKRLLCQEGEFALVLRVLNREGNTLSAVIRTAWDTGDLSVPTKNSPAKATGAHISLLGHITKDELLRHMSNTETTNGFVNRFLWVCVKRARVLPEGGSLPEADMIALAARFADAVAFAQEDRELKRDADARALWRQVYPALSEGKPGLLGAILGRAEAQVMRIACIYALLDRSAEIQRIHLEAALAVWRYCEASAQYLFGESLGNPLADDLYELLRQAPNGLTRNEICNHFGRHRSAKEIATALGLLAEYGKARMAKDAAAGGRPAERWFSITPVSSPAEPGELSQQSEVN